MESRILELLEEHEPGDLIIPLREFANAELLRGYPREELLNDFECVRSMLEAEDREDEEDDLIAVMDALTGYCSPAARL